MDSLNQIWPHSCYNCEHTLSAGNDSFWTAHNDWSFQLLSPMYLMPIKGSVVYLMCNSVDQFQQLIKKSKGQKR